MTGIGCQIRAIKDLAVKLRKHVAMKWPNAPFEALLGLYLLVPLNELACLITCKHTAATQVGCERI